MLFQSSTFNIDNLTENRLEATVFGHPRENYKIKTEIKAATYHALKIEETEDGFVAEVIFDV